MLTETNYETLIKALVEKIDVLEWTNKSNGKQIAELRKENNTLKAENHRLEVENENLKINSTEIKEIDE